MAALMSSVQTAWSGDGNWFWDGANWNDALSEDGKWRFDCAGWQVGTTSILIYILLLWLCGPISAIFVWFTGWSMTSKIITTFISLIGLIVTLFLLFVVHVVPTTSG